jgi:signal transduction histidine kinase
MYSQMLADGIVKDEAARQEYFVTLKDESERLRRIVDNVLGYARLEGRQQQQELQPINAEDLLDRVMPTLERRVSESEMELNQDLRLRPDCVLMVDVQTIEQVLFNLVDNACKYGVNGGSSIRLEARTTRDDVIFAVLDHGPGIPPELRSSIFKPFRRAAADQEGAVPGIGLGLSLARGMSRAMGGDVKLVEREGFGAVFELHLPTRTG